MPMVSLSNGLTEPSLPSDHDREIARESSQGLAKLVGLQQDVKLRVEGPDDESEVVLTPAALHLLVRLLTEMAKGNAVTLIPLHAELTTQQAADVLNVSRPFVVKLLEEKRIPYHMVGTHRRIKFQDLMDYKQRIDSEREQSLDELTKQAQEMDMGY